jgi:hypothetical protein
VKCGPTEVCAPTGCAATCPAPTKLCGASCVDVTVSAANCGDCNVACPAPANADPVCTSSHCGITCHTGFDDCDGNPANGCEPLGTFYQDSDKDGYGGTVSVKQCTAPAGYVSAAGDCNDANAQVHPGQTSYFTSGYTNLAGSVSYDYDCDAVETEDPAGGGFVHLTDCGVACDGEGYLTNLPVRSGSGVDPFCGSTRYELCISIGSPRVFAPTCTQNLLSVTAVTCR